MGRLLLADRPSRPLIARNSRDSSRVWPTISGTSRAAPAASACQGVTGSTSPSTTGANGVSVSATWPHRSSYWLSLASTASPAATSRTGSTPDRSATVARRPSSAAMAAAMSAASGAE